MTDEELKNLVASLAVSQKETDAKFKETDAKFKETDRFLKEIGKAVGSYGNVEGQIFEDQIFYSFQKHPYLNDIKFEEVQRNWKRSMHGLAAEYDVVLLNGSFVGVVEAKRKLEKEDVIKFSEKTLPVFKSLYPDMQDKKLIGAFAAATVDERVLDAAKDAGILILTQDGQALRVVSDTMKEY